MENSTTWSGPRPSFSVIMPVHDPNLRDLERAIASVHRQVWPDVELCLVDDGSKNDDVLRFLEAICKVPGVQFRRHPRALGIAGATNAALELASGEFAVFLDHDDELSPDALVSVANALRDDPDLDFIYSDHDLIDDEGIRQQVRYKPGWSPDLLLSYMYIGHIKVARLALTRALGGFRQGFDGAADYDFMLRLAERTDRIRHIPEVLYHWRAAENSMARRSDTKPQAFESGRKAVAEALVRRGIRASAEWPGWARRAAVGVYRTRFEQSDDGLRSGAKVCILIPTRDRLDLLAACVASVEERTDYPNWEILILDNDSRDPATLEYFERTPHRVVSVPGDFNFSRIVNRGVDASDGEFVLLLNNDTIVVSTDWLTEMVGSASIAGVGVVGAKLLYPDGRIQHAGVTMGVHGLTGHAFDGRPDRYSPLEEGFFARVPRNVSAVTAACLLVRRDLYRTVGGFDEQELGVAWNDTDFCLRVGEAGWRIVNNPLSELIHKGSASRGESKNDREIGVMFRKWAPIIERDPYYNPNLSRLHTDFRPRTQLDESSLFHYSPEGFVRQPGQGRNPAGRAGEELSASLLREISLNQQMILSHTQAALARIETADRFLRVLRESPLVGRIGQSRKLRRLLRPGLEWARSERGRAWIRRLGLTR